MNCIIMNKKLSNEGGSCLFMYLNIKIATWRVCKSVTFKVFNLRNNGSVWAKKKKIQYKYAMPFL